MLPSELIPIVHHSDASIGSNFSLTSELIPMLTSELIPMLTSEFIPIVHHSDANIGSNSDA